MPERRVRVMMMMMRTHLDDGLGDEGVEVRHQFAVDVSHVEVLCNDGDEAHRPVTDPQVGVTQERSYGQITQSSSVKAHTHVTCVKVNKVI